MDCSWVAFNKSSESFSWGNESCVAHFPTKSSNKDKNFKILDIVWTNIPNINTNWGTVKPNFFKISFILSIIPSGAVNAFEGSGAPKPATGKIISVSEIAVETISKLAIFFHLFRTQFL